MKGLLISLSIVILTLAILNWQPIFAVCKGDHYLGRFEVKEMYFDDGKEIYVVNLWDVIPND